MANVAPIKRGDGRNWHASGVECRVFTLAASFGNDHWDYAGFPLDEPINSAAELRRLVRQAGKNAWYVYISSAIGLRLITDPSFDLVSMLQRPETRETDTLIETRLPQAFMPARWLRIIPDWQRTLAPIWVTTKQGAELVKLEFRPIGD